MTTWSLTAVLECF